MESDVWFLDWAVAISQLCTRVYHATHDGCLEPRRGHSSDGRRVPDVSRRHRVSWGITSNNEHNQPRTGTMRLEMLLDSLPCSANIQMESWRWPRWGKSLTVAQDSCFLLLLQMLFLPCPANPRRRENKSFWRRVLNKNPFQPARARLI